MSNQSVGLWKPPSVSDALVVDWRNLKSIDITAKTNNYNDTAFKSLSGWRIDLSAGKQDLTGIVNTVGGTQAKIIFNDSIGGAENNLKLKHEDASSLAANRFALPEATDFDLFPGDGYWIIYDTVRSRWIVFGGGRH